MSAKKGRYKKLSGYTGIFRIMVLDKETQRWSEPTKGSRYAAYGYADQPDGSKKRRKMHFESFEEARAFNKGDSPFNRRASPSAELKADTKYLFKNLVEEWKSSWLPHKAISTQIRYKSYIQHFEFFTDLPVEEIQPTHIDSWITHIKSKEYLSRFHTTRCNYDHEASVLKQIFYFYCSRKNRNYRLPFLREHSEMLRVREKPEVKKDLSVEEFKAFLMALKEISQKNENLVFYYLALMQYLIYGRVQDAAALHFEDFNLERGEITVNKKVVWPRAKGYEPFIETGSKANGGKTIPLNDFSKSIFQEWKMLSGNRDGLLFKLDGKIITYRQIEYIYSKALKAAKLPYTATHILRHAALTEFYDTCKDLLQTAKVAGHGSLKSTEKYAKTRDERIKNTQLLMDQKLSGLLVLESPIKKAESN